MDAGLSQIRDARVSEVVKAEPFDAGPLARPLKRPSEVTKEVSVACGEQEIFWSSLPNSIQIIK